MKLKTKYALYIIVLHTTLVVLALVIYNYNRILFVLCESIILISFALSVYYYRSFFNAFNLFNAGVDSIADKDFSIKFLPVGQPEFDRLIEVYNGMIDQLRLERTKASEKHFFLEKLIDASPAGIILFDVNDSIEKINSAGFRILNLEDRNNLKTIHDLPKPWDTELPRLKENSTALIQIDGINQFKCFKSYFLDRGVKRTFYFVEELTKELLKAERQAYETVIRMISHEVNNSVGSTNSILDSSIQFMRGLSHSRINNFVEALTVARERTSSLNVFAKRFADIVHIPLPDIRKCDLKEITSLILLSYQNDFNTKSIELNTYFEPGDVFISFDAQQLELVLANIIKNAIQAIDLNGKINVIITKMPLSLSVENDGEVIPAEIQRRLFEPFFTTKKAGQGIGLTLIREILINHEAEFSLKTRNDGITEFHIQFKN